MKLTYEQKLERIARLRPIDDIFFEVLAEDKYVCQEILQTIMCDPRLRVGDVVVQSSKRNIYGRSVRLDALCTLGDGLRVNVEVQRSDDDDHLRRVRFNASSITVKESNPGENFKDVVELYVIYITEFDLFNEGKTVYHVSKRIDETGTAIDDGLHEIYVNAAIDDGSDTAELMKCFMSERVDNPRFPTLSGRVKKLKNTQGGRSNMCKIMDDILKEDRKDQTIERIQKMLRKGMSPKDIMYYCEYTAEEVSEAQREMVACTEVY